LRCDEDCCRPTRRDIATSGRRDFPKRPVDRAPEARRFDEKKAADRIAVCSLKMFPATANR